jgi:hypothetical protein
MKRASSGFVAIYLALFGLAMLAYGVWTWISSAQDEDPGTLLGGFLVVFGLIFVVLAGISWSRRG